MKKIINFLLPFIFSILIAVSVIIPYFHKGYFPTHDGEWAVVRLADMFRTLRDFQVPVRYSGALNFGYGYPLFNFAYPLPYYLGTSFHFLGIGFVDTMKILFAGSVLLSAFFMFLASSRLWKNTWAGVVSTIIYVYLPYRMVNLYVRGSIGESVSFVLFPLLFYQAIKLIKKPSYSYVLLIAISIASLITTHNIMAVFFLPVLVIFIVSQIIIKNKKEVIRPFVLSIILGLGISAFFWMPALVEKNNILLSKIPIADRNLYFVRLDQFLLPRWGYGVPTDSNGFSYQLGIPHLFILFLVIFYLFFKFLKNRNNFRECSVRTVLLLSSIIALFIFLLFRPSTFLWEHLPFLSEINYPWTTLSVLGFLVSLMAGFLCRQKYTRYIVICLSLISIIMYLPYAKPQYYADREDNYYLTNEATTTSSDELMPLWVKKKPIQRFKEKVEVIEGVGKVRSVFYNSKKITFNIDAKNNTKVRVNTIYYPGWNAITNNQKSNIDYRNEKGVMEIEVSKGENTVELKFSETPLRLFADLFTIFSFIALILISYRILLRRGLSSTSST